jgi:hypothetical protein
MAIAKEKHTQKKTETKILMDLKNAKKRIENKISLRVLLAKDCI